MSDTKIPFENTIEQLLQRFECVILPGFGGFIVRDSPCNFNASKDQVKPFGRHIFFNPHLQQNDGLLVSEIQKQEGCGYNEANALCTAAVDALKSGIDLNGHKSFGNLGVFHKGQENIWFAPASALNLALESYGLRPVDVRLINADTEQKTDTLIVHKPAAAKTLVADNTPIEKTDVSGPGLRPWLIAASLALLVHFVYLGLEKKDFSKQEASVIPVISMPAETPLAPVEANDSIVQADSAATVYEVPAETVAPEYVSAPIETISPAVSDTPVITEELLNPAEEMTVAPETIRVARYKMETNAEFHAKDLNRKGSKAHVEQTGEWYEVIVEKTSGQ